VGVRLVGVQGNERIAVLQRQIRCGAKIRAAFEDAFSQGCRAAMESMIL